MSREGWIVALGGVLLLLVVPFAMWWGLSGSGEPANGRQRPGDAVVGDSESGETSPAAAPSEPVDEETAPAVEPAPAGVRTVVGVVTDAAGAAVEGVEVALEGDAQARAVTDADGGFAIDDAGVEALVLVFHAFGFAETKADVPEGSAGGRTTQDVVLTPGDDVTGEVLDPEGQPVRDASVTCVPALAAVTPVKTDELGRFTLSRDAAGCDAVASHDGFAESAHVELKLGPRNLVALRALASIHGVIVDPNGSPYTGFVLSLRSFEPADGHSAMRPYHQTFAHPQGRFQVTQLPAGTYVFNVGLRGRSGVSTQAIAVKSGEQLRDVNVVIE